MLGRLLRIGVFGSLAVALVSCSGFRREERAAWRREAELACLKSGQVYETAHVKVAKALEGPGTCGADYPLKVTAIASDSTASSLGSNSAGILTRFNREQTMVCPMVAAVTRWMDDVVQPSALARFGQPVVEIRSMGTYSCRPINNQRGNRLSEHAFANAIDVGGFVLADGRIVSVAQGWKGQDDERYFLREVHGGACRHFSTVLGPGSNALHYDHIHADLARHGRGDRSVCRPYPEPVPPPAGIFPYPNVPDTSTRELRAELPARDDDGEDQLADAVPRSGTGPILPTQRQPSDRLLGAPPDTLDGQVLRSRQAYRQPDVLRPPGAIAGGGPVGPRAQPLQRPAVGQPVPLYIPGNGPYTPGRPEEFDPAEFDLPTGSIGD